MIKLIGKLKTDWQAYLVAADEREEQGDDTGARLLRGQGEIMRLIMLGYSHYSSPWTGQYAVVAESEAYAATTTLPGSMRYSFRRCRHRVKLRLRVPSPFVGLTFAVDFYLSKQALANKPGYLASRLVGIVRHKEIVRALSIG